MGGGVGCITHARTHAPTEKRGLSYASRFGRRALRLEVEGPADGAELGGRDSGRHFSAVPGASDSPTVDTRGALKANNMRTSHSKPLPQSEKKSSMFEFGASEAVGPKDSTEICPAVSDVCEVA